MGHQEYGFIGKIHMPLTAGNVPAAAKSRAMNPSTKVRISLHMKILNDFMGKGNFLTYHYLLLSRLDGCIYISLNVHRFKHCSFENQSFFFYIFGVPKSCDMTVELTLHYVFSMPPKLYLLHTKIQELGEKMRNSGGCNNGLQRYCLVYTCPIADEYISVNS
jgi:hypothetical protein